MKIYIAGPDVFKQESIAIGKKLSYLCEQYNHTGLYPLDNIVDFDQRKQKIAMDIFKANQSLINDCDIVIADLNSFRGLEADDGTVWEIGYAIGLGKKVYCYMDNTSDYISKFPIEDKFYVGDKTIDKDSLDIEDFGLPINLMIACSVEKIIKGNFEDTLKYITEEK